MCWFALFVDLFGVLVCLVCLVCCVGYIVVGSFVGLVGLLVCWFVWFAYSWPETSRLNQNVCSNF